MEFNEYHLAEFGPKSEERLLRLADLLQRKGAYAHLPPIPRKEFDMAIVKRESACGTAACAAGYAGSDPWFRRRGFMCEPAHKEGGETTRFLIKFPYNKCSSFLYACSDFFQISGFGVDQLFFEAPGNNTPHQVAKNIRKFVRQAKRHHSKVEKHVSS